MPGPLDIRKNALIANSTSSTPFRLAQRGSAFFADTILRKRYAAYINSLGQQIAEDVLKKTGKPDALLGIVFTGDAAYFKKCPTTRVNAYVAQEGLPAKHREFKVAYDTGNINVKVDLHIKDINLNGYEYARFVYRQPVIYGQIPELHRDKLRTHIGQALNVDFSGFSSFLDSVFALSRQAFTEDERTKLIYRFKDAIYAALRTCEHLLNLWDICGVKPPDDLNYVVNLLYKMQDLEKWEFFLKPNQMFLNTIKEPLRFWVNGACFFYTPFSPLLPNSTPPSTPFTPGLFVRS